MTDERASGSAASGELFSEAQSSATAKVVQELLLSTRPESREKTSRRHRGQAAVSVGATAEEGGRENREGGSQRGALVPNERPGGRILARLCVRAARGGKDTAGDRAGV